MNWWAAIFSERGENVPERGAPVRFEERVYETVGVRRSRDALQVRDSMITDRRGATTGSRGAFMNRWAPRRERGSVLSKRDGIRYWQEGRQSGSHAAFTNL